MLIKALGKEAGQGRGKVPLGVEGSEHKVQVPTWLTPNMADSTPAVLLVVLRSGFGWIPGDLILPSMYFSVFLLSVVPGPTRVPQEKSNQSSAKPIT